MRVTQPFQFRNNGGIIRQIPKQQPKKWLSYGKSYFSAKRQPLLEACKGNDTVNDVVTSKTFYSQSENVLATIDLNTLHEVNIDDGSFEQETGSPIDQDNNDGSKSSNIT